MNLGLFDINGAIAEKRISTSRQSPLRRSKMISFGHQRYDLTLLHKGSRRW
jgi:hypothetical protein